MHVHFDMFRKNQSQTLILSSRANPSMEFIKRVHTLILKSFDFINSYEVLEGDLRELPEVCGTVKSFAGTVKSFAQIGLQPCDKKSTNHKIRRKVGIF